jgi:hypothetical protein
VARVRACFADLDGAPLEPVLKCALAPAVVVQTSPGRFHAYWPVDNRQPVTLAQFPGVQRAIAAAFGGDTSVVDLPRVMRLPGFAHRKNPERPHRVSMLPPPAQGRPRTAVEMLAAFPPPQAASSFAAPLGTAIGAGFRHAALTSLARTLAARGVCRSAILACLAEVNRAQCRPPLESRRWAEVERAVDWALGKPVLSPLSDDDVDDAIAAMTDDEFAALIKELQRDGR